ncbi:hypothetical protein LVJ94_27440 [Pendulispora rubella]|uniref:Lipoprotein n=1 Tax=Pendulispora rubella TaxID=2741070 RepID=A0ABZ2KUH7_9BACT
MPVLTRLLPVVASVLLAACSGSSDVDIDNGAPSPAPKEGTSTNVAVDDAVTRVGLERAWLGAVGFDVKCNSAHAKMTYDRTTHEATWHVCQQDAYVDRARTLTSDEVARLESMLAAITYQPNPPCDGYDGLFITMTASRADATSRTYAKENLNCYGYPKAPGIGAPFDYLLGKL